MKKLKLFLIAICITSITHAEISSDVISDNGTTKIKPILLEERFMNGIDLTLGDPSEFDDELSGDPSELDDELSFRAHNYYSDKIEVSVYESGPGEVYIENLPYDEYIYILEGKLILILDEGDEYEFNQGDSLIVPRGFKGTWKMPVKYRELIVINTDY